MIAGDRYHLVTALVNALAIDSLVGSGKRGPFDKVRELAAWMREGITMLEARNNTVLQNQLQDWELLLCFLYKQLPVVEEGFSEQPKLGQKTKMRRNTMLVAAFWLVRSRLGFFHDGDVSDLIGNIAPNEQDRLDAEELRERRKYMERTYPELYEIAKATGIQ